MGVGVDACKLVVTYREDRVDVGAVVKCEQRFGWSLCGFAPLDRLAKSGNFQPGDSGEIALGTFGVALRWAMFGHTGISEDENRHVRRLAALDRRVHRRRERGLTPCVAFWIRAGSDPFGEIGLGVVGVE